MSELKSYDLVDIQDYRGEVYLKSKADKVIAELKNKALQYKVLNEEHCRDLNTQERFFAEQIAHHKHKRCLAMAKWCRRYDEFIQLESERLGLAQRTLFLEYRRKSMWWNKWHNRWLELAEKFKETK